MNKNRYAELKNFEKYLKEKLQEVQDAMKSLAFEEEKQKEPIKKFGGFIFIDSDGNAEGFLDFT